MCERLPATWTPGADWSFYDETRVSGVRFEASRDLAENPGPHFTKSLRIRKASRDLNDGADWSLYDETMISGVGFEASRDPAENLRPVVPAFYEELAKTKGFP